MANEIEPRKGAGELTSRQLVGRSKVPILKCLRDISLFTRIFSGTKLRQYQLTAADAILDSVCHRRGHSIVVIFPRQSGKNELQAQIEAYLLLLLKERKSQTEIVKVSPTWKPQTQNAMRRLEKVLNRNGLCAARWVKESGYIYRLGTARVCFLSGQPTANVVGATANLLLECDEAQDVLISKWDKDFAPMAASTHATRVFWGTMWTGDTLLARELKLARELENQDGLPRAFLIGAEQVAQETPVYRRHVDEQIAKLGRQHPLVKTQYFSEELEGQAGMFPERRLSLIQGDHERLHAPKMKHIYALLLDLAGEDEGAGDAQGNLEGRMDKLSRDGLSNPERDAAALTVVEIDLRSVEDELLQAATYRVVDRRSWVGAKHVSLYGEIKALADCWRARRVVVDATSVGAGFASFLDKALPGKVIPFTFNSASKNQLGWEFLTLIETGRFKDYRAIAGRRDPEQEEFLSQMKACQMEISPGPERKMKWGVPDGTRHPHSGEIIHDDWVISAALAAALDDIDWRPDLPALLIRGRDPLEEMDGF